MDAYEIPKLEGFYFALIYPGPHGPGLDLQDLRCLIYGIDGVYHAFRLATIPYYCIGLHDAGVGPASMRCRMIS